MTEVQEHQYKRIILQLQTTIAQQQLHILQFESAKLEAEISAAQAPVEPVPTTSAEEPTL